MLGVACRRSILSKLMGEMWPSAECRRRGLYQPSIQVNSASRASVLVLQAAPVDQLALEGGEEALGHRVVVGVADRAHRRAHAHLLAALRRRRSLVYWLPWSL